MKAYLSLFLLLGLLGCSSPAQNTAPATAFTQNAAEIRSPIAASTPTSTPVNTPTATSAPTPTPTLPPYPVVFAVDPPNGPISGGTEVTISGANFADATVLLGKPTLVYRAAGGQEGNILITQWEAVAPIEQTASSIRLVMPANDNGIAVIKLQSAMGTGYGEFLYLPPSLDEIGPGEITTIAGIGDFFGEGRPAARAMASPIDIEIAEDGSIYYSEREEARIMRIRPDGVLELYAGAGYCGFSPDGIPALETCLNLVNGIALDPQGNLIFADSFSHRIRQIDAHTGIVTTIAGTGIAGFSGDEGLAINAQLDLPNFLDIDRDGNLYFIDFGNMRIRRISPDGIITTIAGTGTVGYSGDGGPAIDAQFNLSFVDVSGLAVDFSGNVYLADTDNFAIRKIDASTETITTVFQGLKAIRSIAVDQSGAIYFETREIDGPQILKMSDGVIVATWGVGRGVSPDGTLAAEALLGYPEKIEIDSQGNILFSDSFSFRLRRINISTGLLETVAGTGPAVIGENGPALGAALHLHHTDLAFLSDGSLLIAAGDDQRIWRLTSSGDITSFIGTGLAGYHGPDLYLLSGSPLDTISITFPLALEVIDDGAVYFSENGVWWWEVDNQGSIRGVAGPLGCCWGFSGDGGPATQAEFMQSWDFALDADGNVFIADTNNNRIRRVDAITGVVNTIAGTGDGNGFENYGQGSFCGDGGPAIEACLNTPSGVAVDSLGNIYIADTYNARIRIIDTEGIITTFVDLNRFGEGLPSKMVFDSEGYLYLIYNCQILRVSPTGEVKAIAGQRGICGFSGDGGPAQLALLAGGSGAEGIAIDSQGNLYFVDGLNGRIRVIKGIAAPRQ
jgi:sugar lactone lactonase YvrE